MISVVIPLYNKQDSIVATLQSVLMQTYQNYEVVVVDDGSTDNSAQVVQEFLCEAIDNKQFSINDDYDLPSIRLIRKANGGVSSARNRGIHEAKYNYIAFLDADDYWEPTYLETQIEMIQDFPEAKMWGTAWGVILENNKSTRCETKVLKDFRGIIDSDTYFENRMFLFWTGIVVIDKRIFNTIDMFDERINYGEDADLWWRIILNFPVAYTNKCLAFYRLDAENRISLSIRKIEKHFIYYAEKYLLYYERFPKFKKYIQHEILSHLYEYYKFSPNNDNVKRILNQIDFSLQPFSYRVRYCFPFFYDLYKKIKNNIKS